MNHPSVFVVFALFSFCPVQFSSLEFGNDGEQTMPSVREAQIVRICKHSAGETRLDIQK